MQSYDHTGDRLMGRPSRLLLALCTDSGSGHQSRCFHCQINRWLCRLRLPYNRTVCASPSRPRL